MGRPLHISGYGRGAGQAPRATSRASEACALARRRPPPGLSAPSAPLSRDSDHLLYTLNFPHVARPTRRSALTSRALSHPRPSCSLSSRVKGGPAKEGLGRGRGPGALVSRDFRLEVYPYRRSRTVPGLPSSTRRRCLLGRARGLRRDLWSVGVPGGGERIRTGARDSPVWTPPSRLFRPDRLCPHSRPSPLL